MKIEVIKKERIFALELTEAEFEFIYQTIGEADAVINEDVNSCELFNQMQRVWNE